MTSDKNETSKANSKGKIPAIGMAIAVIAVAGAISAVNAAKISNSIHKTFSSPAEYYQYVEQKNRDEFLEYNEKIYSSLRDDLTDRANKKTTYHVELGDTLKALLGNNGLESVTLIEEKKQEDTVATGKLQVQLNNKNVLSCNGYLDYAGGESYFQIPELTESYLDTTSLMQEAKKETDLGETFAVFSDLDKYLPEAADVTKLLTGYSDISIEHVSEKHSDTVEKNDNEVLSAEGTSQKCTRLDVNCDDECGYEIAKKMLETMKDDDVIKQMIEKVDSSAYGKFQDRVEASLSELKDSASDTDNAQMQMQVFVDSQADIVGRSIRLKTEEETFEIQQKMPRSGSDYAYDLSVIADGVTYLNVAGSGSIEHGMLSGDFSMSLDDSLNEDTSGAILSMKDLLRVSVKDLDLNALLHTGKIKGEFSLSTDQVPKLSGYTLRVKTDGTKKKHKDEIFVMVGSDKFATLTIQQEEGGDPGVVKPDASAVKYDFSDETQLSLYVSEIDLDSFLKDLRTSISVDLTPFLEELNEY